MKFLKWVSFLISELFWFNAYLFRGWLKPVLILVFFSVPSFSQVGQVSFFLSTTSYCPDGWVAASGNARQNWGNFEVEGSTGDIAYHFFKEIYEQGSPLITTSGGAYSANFENFYPRFGGVDLVQNSTQTDTFQGHYHHIDDTGGRQYRSRDGTVQLNTTAGYTWGLVHSGASGTLQMLQLPPTTYATYGTIRISSETRPKTSVLLACVKVSSESGSNYYVQYSSEVVSVTLTAQDLKDFQNFLFVIFFFWLVISAWKLAR